MCDAVCESHRDGWRERVSVFGSNKACLRRRRIAAPVGKGRFWRLGAGTRRTAVASAPYAFMISRGFNCANEYYGCIVGMFVWDVVVVV